MKYLYTLHVEFEAADDVDARRRLHAFNDEGAGLSIRVRAVLAAHRESTIGHRLVEKLQQLKPGQTPRSVRMTL